MLPSETTPAAAPCWRPIQKTEPTTASQPRRDMGEVSYRIFRSHRGWMSYLYLTDPTQSPPSVQNRAWSDSRRKNFLTVGLLTSAMAGSRVSLVLRWGLSLPHNAAPD